MGCTVRDHGVVSSARRRRRSSCEGEPGGRREVAVVVNDEGFEFIEFLTRGSAGTPATASAVARASARPRSVPVTVADAAREVGSPVCGSIRCPPRS